MRHSWQIRLTSTLLAAVMTSTTVAQSALAAEYTEPIPSVAEETASGDTVAEMERILGEQLGAEVTLQPRDDTADDSAAGTSADADTSDATGGTEIGTETPDADGGNAEGSTAADQTETGGNTAAQDTTAADGTGEETSDVPTDAATAQNPSVSNGETVGDGTDLDDQGTATDDTERNTIGGIAADITESEDGTITMTGADGNSVTLDPETNTITGEIDLTEEQNLAFDADDAAAAGEYEYLGTDDETGAAHYMMQFDHDDDEEYATSDEENLAEARDIVAWMNEDTLSGDSLASAMQAAADYDQYVLDHYYEPVYADVEESISTQSQDEDTYAVDDEFDDADEDSADDENRDDDAENADDDDIDDASDADDTDDEDITDGLERDEAAAEDTASAEGSVAEDREIVGYRLKDTYREQTIDTDLVSFGSADTDSVRTQSDDGIALMSEDGDADLDDNGVAARNEVTPEYQSATVVIVDNSIALIRVLDAETGEGIIGASVSVTMGGTTQNAMTTALTGDPETAGSVILDLNGNTSVQDAFVNISAANYRGITRVSETVEGGTVLTYRLHRANDGEIYLRGATVDGLDAYETNLDLYICAANKSEYDIIAFVERVGHSPLELPTDLQIQSGGVSKMTGDVTTIEQGNNLGYRAYTFRGQWSKYDTINPIFRPGERVTLKMPDSYEWANGEADEDDRSVIPLKIDVSLPVIEETGCEDFSLSLSPTSGAGVTLPSSMPVIGGASLNISALSVIPVSFYGSPDGTILIGYGDSIDLKEMLSSLKDQGDSSQIKPSEQKKRLSVGEKIEEKFNQQIQDGRDLAQTLREKKADKKRFHMFGDGSLDLYYGLIALIKLDRRSGYLDGKLSLYVMVDGSYTGTIYLTTVPIYIGTTVGASARLSFTAGTHMKNLVTSEFFDGLTDDTGIALLIGGYARLFVGAGIQGLVGIEVYGSVSADVLLDIVGPLERQYPRYRVYGYADAGWRAYVAFLEFQKNYSLVSTRLHDSWNIEDPDDQNAELPSSPILNALSIDDTDGGDAGSATILAGEELHEPVMNAADAEYGLYVQQDPDGDTAEIAIAEDGNQTLQKEYTNPTIPGESAVNPAGNTQMILQGITSSQEMIYSGVYYAGHFFRIANVQDDQYYGGKTVPRVTVVTANEDGLNGTPVAMPATVDADGEVYGYDYSYGIYTEDYKYIYLAIASTSIDPAEHTLQEVAENTRIRVLLIQGADDVIAQRVLDKPAINGSTAYLYSGTPVVYGNTGLSGGVNPFMPERQAIGGYTVACNVTTDLNALTAATVNMSDDSSDGGTATISDALYVASNISARDKDDPHAAILQDGTVRGNLQIVYAYRSQYSQAGQPMIAYVDNDNPSVLGLVQQSNTPDRMSLVQVKRYDMGGEVHNLQYANQRMSNTLYCTVDGQLQSIELSYTDGISMQQTAYPTETDTGENVVLPVADGVQILEAEGSVFLVTVMPVQGDQVKKDGRITYKTDSVITVYTLYQDGDTYRISGPRETVLKDRSVFNATCAITRDRYKSLGYIIRMMYLADQQSTIVRRPSGTLDASGYEMGVTDDVCNLYMWELHTGIASQLNSLEPASSIIRSKDGYLYLNAQMQNTGAVTADYVTVRVTTDVESQADAQDIDVYFSDDYTASGSNRRILGPGSTTDISIKVPLKDTWSGLTTLYAAIVQVNGQNMTNGYEPVWIDSGQLLDNGDYGLHAEEDGIGGEPYATVRVDNYSAMPFAKVAVDMEVSYYSDAVDDWQKVARYSLDTIDSADQATGYEDMAATLHIPLKDYWNDRNVYAVRFSVVSVAGDITLNNTYRISETLLRPDQPGETTVFIYADAEDATMGSVSMMVGTEQTEQDRSGQYVDKGTDVMLTALANEGYEFDHWEIYDYGSDQGGVWVVIPDQGPTMQLTAGKNVPGTSVGEDEDILMIRSCYRADGITRAVILTVEAVPSTAEDGTQTITYQQGGLSSLLTVTQEPGASGEIARGKTIVAGADAYRLKNGATIVATPTYSEDLWSFDGWYTFTYDDLGRITVGERTTLADAAGAVTITQNESRSEVCVAAIFRENESSGSKVYLDANGGTLATGSAFRVNEWVTASSLSALPTAGDLVRDGYVLTGWALSDGTLVTDVSALQARRTVLFAQWESTTAELVAFSESDYGEIRIEGASKEDPGYKVYQKGETARVIATPAAGCSFDHWEIFDWDANTFRVIEGVTDTVYTLTMNRNTYLMAVFTKDEASSATVDVEWIKEDGASQPDTIEVQLTLEDGTTVGGVIILNEENGWTYTWEDLDKDTIYDLVILNVPDKDTAEWIRNEEGGFTIRYTCGKDSDPTDPTKPTDPTDPTGPTNPTKPTDPTDPTNPGDHGNGGDSGSSSGSSSSRSVATAAQVTSTKVKVTWALNDGVDRPEFIKVRLTRGDGTAASDVVTLNEDNSWTWRWDGLTAGKTYLLEVLDVNSAYKAVVYGDVTHGFNITCSDRTAVSVNSGSRDVSSGQPAMTVSDGRSDLPGDDGTQHLTQMGDDSHMMLSLAMVMLSLMALAQWYAATRRRDD